MTITDIRPGDVIERAWTNGGESRTVFIIESADQWHATGLSVLMLLDGRICSICPNEAIYDTSLADPDFKWAFLIRGPEPKIEAEAA